MSSVIQDSYDQLLERSKRLTVLGTTAALAGWDMQTYMPARGIGLRSEQLSLMSILYHQALTDPKVEELLDKIEGVQGVRGSRPGAEEERPPDAQGL